MFRQSPRRNGRNKGLKIKHVLQISVLLGVSVWLLYQVHHSDDKKSPVPPNITKKLHNVVSKDMLRLGRKDLQPKVKEQKKETEEHQAEEVGGNETEPEDLVHDHESEEHEDMKHEEDREHEEETTETQQEHIKGHDNEEMKDKENGEKKNKVVMDNKDEKKTSQENVLTESKKDDTSGKNGPSTQKESNLMPSVDIKSAIMVNGNSEDSMNLNGEVENQKEQESNENENNEESSEGKSEEGGVLEDEKEALTDLGTLPESGIGGSRSTENTAAE